MNTADPFSLAGRVALVTGSSRGLGRAMAVALGKAQAKVALNYCHSLETAERAFADFRSQKLEGMLARADVTDEDISPADFTAVRLELNRAFGGNGL